MRVLVEPGSVVRGRTSVPGDKSVSHRWLILAATGRGRSLLRDLPPSLDVRSTARCLAAIAPSARAALETWASDPGGTGEDDGFTWDVRSGASSPRELVVEGEGRAGLVASDHALDCGNSGSTMRLLAGVLVARRFTTILTGDESVRARPMERLARPLRSMGATVGTVDGHAPIEISGGRLRAVEVRLPVPTAQVKSAVLLAGLEADGTTTVLEPAPTRDHTERALACLGVRVTTDPLRVSVEPSEHGPLEGHVPGDVSSAAFLVAAAAVTGGEVEVHGVGLNPTRTHFLRVLERMGVDVEEHVEADSCGEPVGTLRARGPGRLLATTVDAWEIPLVIDEVPVLAAVASHASTDSWFVGAGELRVKESDRLRGIAASLRDLGGIAAVEGDDLVVAGGGLRGGATSSRGDHRMAMAMTVAALGADGPTRVDGIEAADVSFPGFVSVVRALGAAVTP